MTAFLRDHTLPPPHNTCHHRQSTIRVITSISTTKQHMSSQTEPYIRHHINTNHQTTYVITDRALYTSSHQYQPPNNTCHHRQSPIYVITSIPTTKQHMSSQTEPYIRHHINTNHQTTHVITDRALYASSHQYQTPHNTRHYIDTNQSTMKEWETDAHMLTMKG